MITGSNGNVGIGTTAPLGRLHVEHDQNAYTRMLMKNTNAGSAAQAVTHYETDQGSFTCGLTSGAHSLSGAALLWNVPNTNIVFATNNTQRMVVSASGEVGIGTTTPIRGLEVISGNGIEFSDSAM